MYEQEKRKSVHLLILLCCTIFTLILTGEAVLLGWETGAVFLLLVGVIASWIMHITGKLAESIRLWFYLIMSMLAFFFYGIHETSIYDMAPVMLTIILIYSTAEMYSIIRICVLVYFATMCYDFFFVLNGSAEFTILSVTRTLLHLGLVYMAGKLAKIVILRRSKERENTESRIAQLEETNRRTENFLANVSHELRTPINAVTGISSVMLKKEKNADKRKEILSVQEAGNRLFNQIEDILDYTEIDTGKIKVSEESYTITSLINDIITGNRLLMKEDAPELIFDIDAKIPSLLFGDARKIKKILKHLIDNGIKYTQKGGIYVRIYTLMKPYGVNLCISVCDTGIGIEKEDLVKITEKFYKTEGGKSRRAGGLGLGLAIVHGMASAMEGFMQLESSVDGGTRVSVSIPQKVSDKAPIMVIENRKELCLGCFLRAEKFEVPRVREYYNEMISHLICGLDMPLHRVYNMDELEKLICTQHLTHLFIGKEEYEENPSFFERMAEEKTQVVLVANENYLLSGESKMNILRKPFYSYSLVNFLNAGRNISGEDLQKKHMICRNVKTLVVDDEPMNLLVAKEIFREYEMEVETAGSGADAIAACEKQDFDLIFLDHMMPGMDGVETLRRLRKIQTDTGRVFTIIAFTANAVSGAREMFFQEGFDEFISKPIEYLELEHVLKRVLPKSSILYLEEESEEKEKKSIIDEPKEDVLSRLEKAKIHTALGLQYCRDKAFYIDLLGQVVRNSEKKQEDLEHFFEQKDFDNYRIAVHALKSTSKMLGAVELSEMAMQAETALKNQNVEYVTQHHEELMRKYSDTAHAILSAITVEKSGELSDSANDNEISLDELIRDLEDLKENLSTCEMKKIEPFMRDICRKRYGDRDMGEMLRDALQDVEEFEFEEAAGKVDALLKKARGGEIG